MGAVDPGGTLETCLHISCPKVGLQLLTGEEWMALTPRVPGSPFHILEAGVRDVQLNLPATGLPFGLRPPQDRTPCCQSGQSMGQQEGFLGSCKHLCVDEYVCA